MLNTDPRLEAKYRGQAVMLANRVRKRFQHLRKRFAREQIDVFRLYDWDIPEIRAVVDWYAGHLVVGEYTRKQSTPEWLPMIGRAVAEAMGCLGIRVERPDQIRPALEQAFAANRPVVIDVHSDIEAQGPQARG